MQPNKLTMKVAELAENILEQFVIDNKLSFPFTIFLHKTIGYCETTKYKVFLTFQQTLALKKLFKEVERIEIKSKSELELITKKK